MEPSPVSPPPGRRNFLTKALAVAIGSVLGLVPAIAGLFVLFDPLRRKSEAGAFVKVGPLSAVPENGAAQKFQVLKTKTDVWNVTPDQPVGAVYLQRIAGGGVRALNAKCPHAGCFVNFKAGDAMHYHCPCHNSSFAMDGKILDPNSPSPRALDELPAEVRGTDVYVRFQNFRVGVKEKEPS